MLLDSYLLHVKLHYSTNIIQHTLFNMVLFNNNNIYLLNHTYNNNGYKWTPQEVIDLYML